jgi:hypothetical protein
MITPIPAATVFASTPPRSAASKPATATPPNIASAKLIDDADLLRRIYESAHPGLYRYNTKAQMDRHFEDLRVRLDRDLTLAETYVAISQFLARIRCGHSYANFFSQTEPVARALFPGKNRVPFAFRWIGGRMIVTKDLPPRSILKPGTEVLFLPRHLGYVLQGLGPGGGRGFPWLLPPEPI